MHSWSGDKQGGGKKPHWDRMRIRFALIELQVVIALIAAYSWHPLLPQGRNWLIDAPLDTPLATRRPESRAEAQALMGIGAFASYVGNVKFYRCPSLGAMGAGFAGAETDLGYRAGCLSGLTGAAGETEKDGYLVRGIGLGKESPL